MLKHYGGVANDKPSMSQEFSKPRRSKEQSWAVLFSQAKLDANGRTPRKRKSLLDVEEFLG